MSDAVLKIAAIVETDAIKQGTAENVQAIAEGNQKIAISFQEVQSISSAAWRKIGTDVKAAAQSVSADSLKAAEATKALKLAQDDLANSMKLRNSSMLTGVQVDGLIAASQERVRIAALAVAEAQGQVAVASHASVTEIQATSAAVRTFEGNPGIRAMEMFIGKTLGLGPLMKGLFPLVGIAAFAKVLFDIWGKLDDIETKAREAGDVTSKAVQDQHDKYQVTLVDLQLTSQLLQDQIDKISGKPNNGIATALLEAKKMADQLLTSLQGDQKALQDLLGEHEVSGWASALTGLTGKQTKASTWQAEELAADYEKYKSAMRSINADYEAELDKGPRTPEAIKAAGDKRIAAIKEAGQKELDAADREAKRLQAEEVSSRQPVITATRNGIIRSTPDGVDNSKRIADMAAYKQAIQKDMDEAAEQNTINSQHVTLGHEKQDHGDDGASKAAEARLRAMEEARLAEEQEGKLGAKADADYWSARIDKFKKGSTEYLAVQEKIERDRKDLAEKGEVYNAEQARGAEIEAKNAESLALANIQLDLADGKITKLAADKLTAAAHTAEYTTKLVELRAQLEAINSDKGMSPEDKKNKGAAVQNQIADVSGQQASSDVQDRAREAEAAKEASDKAAVAAQRLAAEVAKATEIQSQNAESLDLATIAAKEQDGSITKLSADHLTAAARTKEYTDKLAALAKELKDLKSVGSGLQSGSDADTANQTDQQKVQNEINQLKGQQATAAVGNNAKISQDVAAPWLSAFNAIDKGWLKVQNDLIAGNGHIERDFAQMGLSMVQESAKWAEQILAHEAQRLIKTQIANQVANQVKVAGDATAAAESTAIKQAAGLKQAIIDAKAAGVAGWRAGMAMPFPENLVMAPTLAAVGFTGAMAQFEHGGVVNGVPGMAVPIIAHAGERVLTVAQTEQLHRVVDGRANGGGNTLHMRTGDMHFHGSGDAGDMGKHLERHQKTYLKALHQWSREGKMDAIKKR